MRIALNFVLGACVASLAACSGSGEPSHETFPPARSDSPAQASTQPEMPWHSGPDVPLAPLPPSQTMVDNVPPPPPEVPTDTRSVRSAVRPPVPISGGTLIVTPDGKYAVAADPDRDRVSVVDIEGASLLHTIGLNRGDEPGRLAADDQGRIHVALRRAGSVASIDLATGKVIDRRTVCPTPRGIAFDAAAHNLLVACASGELVTLPADGGDASANVFVDADLRDIVPTKGGIFVSRFKRAELLALADGGSSISKRSRPPDVQDPGEVIGLPPIDGPEPEPPGKQTLESEVAWRTVSDTTGGAIMLHQGARVDEITLGNSDDLGGGGSAYGGGNDCGGVVQAELTHMDVNGEPLATTRFKAVLAVDVAVAPSGSSLAVVQAGERDPNQPPLSDGVGSASALLKLAIDDSADQACVGAQRSVSIPWHAVAVAYVSDKLVVVQTREPAMIVIVDDFASEKQVELGGDSVYDTAHELFHRDAGAGIACASCHAEGGDDGHVWVFTDVGKRRTQSVNVGLEGTAPFHWSGDQPDIASLMEDVFVHRMGGVHESPERTQALQSWLFGLHPLPPQRAADDEAALRGQALFEGECSTCHSGPKLTNNATVDVGTGEAVQVPSLRGVGYRSPLIHYGCAVTLEDRFDQACGGLKHGNTEQLSDSQIEDLVAYLQTL